MPNYTTLLRWGVLAAIFAALAAPFVIADGGAMYDAQATVHNLYIPVANFFFPYITGKNFVFRILVEVALVCYALLALRVPKYRPKGSALMWAVVALAVWMGLSTLASVDPIKSFWSNFERMDGYVTLLHLFAWFVITGAMLTADDLWGAFLETAVGAATLQGAIALLQVTHIFKFAPSSQSGPRADTTFGNATYLAVYMLCSIFITLFVLARRGERGRLGVGLQVWYGLALVLQVMALFFSETRGAQLGTVGGLFIAAVWVALFARDAKYRSVRRASLWALGVIAVLVVGFVGIRDTSFVRNTSGLNRLASISLSDPTVASRLLYIWPTALKGIADKPLAGWGYENFNFVFNAYYQPAMYNQEQWFDRAHNEFLDMGIAGGVPALALYVALFGLAAWTIWRSRLGAPEQAVLMGLLAAYSFNNLFVFDNLVSYLYFFALLAFVHSLAPQRPPRVMAFTRPMGERGLAVMAPVVLVVVGFGGWYLNAAGLARAAQLVQGLSAQSGPQQNLAYFTRALDNTAFPGNQLGYQETAEQLAQFTMSQVWPSSIDPALKQQYFAAVRGGMQTLLAERPHDARLELFMGTALSSGGASAEALTYLKQAAADSPRKQQILIQLGLLEVQTGDTQGALATMKQAFDEEPSYDFARIMYAAAYYYAGQTALGDRLLVDKWGSTVVDNDQLLQVYNTLKMYDRVEAVWQLRIKGSPQDISLYLGLAQAYFTAGDKTNTIATLQQIAKVQPSAAAQVQALIAQIQDGTLKPPAH
jgi:O-antigen ligase/tetratricopeptide (TPR) repeat protein